MNDVGRAVKLGQPQIAQITQINLGLVLSLNSQDKICVIRVICG